MENTCHRAGSRPKSPGLIGLTVETIHWSYRGILVLILPLLIQPFIDHFVTIDLRKCLLYSKGVLELHYFTGFFLQLQNLVHDNSSFAEAHHHHIDSQQISLKEHASKLSDLVTKQSDLCYTWTSGNIVDIKSTSKIIDSFLVEELKEDIPTGTVPLTFYSIGRLTKVNDVRM